MGIRVIGQKKFEVTETELLQQEARGNHVEVGFITVHAQDHFSCDVVFQDLISTLIDVYKK